MNWLWKKFKENSDKTAVVFNNRRYSYGELLETTERFYAQFAGPGRIRPGSVIALSADYSFEAVCLFLALFKNRDIIVPIASGLDAEIRERLEEAGVEEVARLDGQRVHRYKTEPAAARTHAFITQLQADRRAGLILFSSGTTGKPKAMVHDLERLVETYRDKRGKSLNLLVFLLFDHIGGLNTLFNSLSMGTTLVIPENRESDHICRLIETWQVHVLPASPTFLNLLVMSDAYKHYDLSSLKMITYGTEAMPESLLHRLKELFPRVRLLQTFGTSETGIARVKSKSSTSTLIKIEDPNLQYKVVDGELWLKSKTRVLGYLNAPMDNFTGDGWYKTGDLVEEAADGYLGIIGRNSDVINVGGEKVLPVEVESLIMQMEEIVDCLVYGESNPITGQTAAAEVIVKEGVDTSSIAKKVRLFCKGRIARYKIPVKIRAVSQLNVGSRHKKIRKREV